MQARGRDWTIAIFVAVFAWYLVTSSREIAWGDARPMWEVADRIAQERAIDIRTKWPDDMPPGRNGKIYGIAPIGPSLVHLPGVAFTGWTHSLAPRHEPLLKPLFTHLAPAALGALACVVFFGLLRDLGRTARTASLCTAILAFATTTWVYARMPYSEILQLACFLGLVRASLAVANEPSRRTGLWLGLWAGMLLNSKYVFALAIGGAAVLIVWTLRKRRGELVRVLSWAAVTGAPFVVLALAYNYLRFESIFRSGYEPYLDWYFGGSMFDGAWGMLASPNKSVLLYSPPLVLAAIGWTRAVRQQPRLGLLLVLVVVPTFLVYCTYRSWSGDYAWGPRFIVWAVPILLVGLAWFCDELTRVRRIALGLVVAGGIAVNALGSALYWDHFIRISIDVKNQWLGNPNRSGAYIPERGRGHCDSCFEDTYEILWTPAFHPIKGHWWLLTSIARGDADGREAQIDAPWRRYTKLEMNLASTYPRARIDWWGMLWIKDAPHTRALGLVLLLLLVAAAGLGITKWIRLHRSAISGPDAEGRD